MRVLVACEYSARVRDAFRRHGHDAWSCDLLECEADPQWHLRQPVEDVLADGWDLMVAHPPCTHLAVSGSRHFYRKQRDCPPPTNNSTLGIRARRNKSNMFMAKKPSKAEAHADSRWS